MIGVLYLAVVQGKGNPCTVFTFVWRLLELFTEEKEKKMNRKERRLQENETSNSSLSSQHQNRSKKAREKDGSSKNRIFQGEEEEASQRQIHTTKVEANRLELK